MVGYVFIQGNDVEKNVERNPIIATLTYHYILLIDVKAQTDEAGLSGKKLARRKKKQQQKRVKIIGSG